MSTNKKEKKVLFQKKLTELLQNYNKILLIGVDNVGANNIQKTRSALRGKAIILFGKNTLIRKTIRDFIEKCNEAGNKEAARVEALLPLMRGNVGLIFTNGDLSEIKEVAESFKQKAAAKAGAFAPSDVFVDPGPTGMEPTQTQFLQALDIPSKIVKGQVEIVSRIHLIKQGNKIGTSEATLLDKLNIMPFSYNAVIKTVFDAGFVYPASLLSLGKNDVMKLLAKAIQRVATISLETGLPSISSVPHIIAKAYKNLVSVSVETDYEFEGSKDVKAFLKDPSAFQVAVPVASTEVKEEVKETPVEEQKEEESASLGDIFGGSEEDD